MLTHATDPVAPWRPWLTAADEIEHARSVIYDIADVLRHWDFGDDQSLASGRSGAALFFLYAARTLDDERYAAHATVLLDIVIEALATQHLPITFFSGVAGIGWTLAHAQRLGLPSVLGLDLGELDDLLCLRTEECPWSGHFDLVSGLVGIGHYALEREANAQTEQLLRNVLDRLLEMAEATATGITWYTPERLMSPVRLDRSLKGVYDLGVAHGVSGVISLLTQMVARNPSATMLTSLLRASIAFLRSTVSDTTGVRGQYTSFYLPGAKETRTRDAWCYGDLGVAPVLIGAAAVLCDNNLRKHAHDAVRAVAVRSLEGSGVVDASVCHGAAGSALILGRLAHALHDESLAMGARRWFLALLDHRRPTTGVAGFSYFSPLSKPSPWVAVPGLLEGAAGIGLTILSGLGRVAPDWDRHLGIPAALYGSFRQLERPRQ